MIKKLLFAGALALAFNSMNAQVQVWKDDFNDQDVSNWALYDEDGDGNDWFAVQSVDSAGNPSGSPVIRSNSYLNNVGALTPDNWIVSPMVDLTNASGTISLSWKVFATDPAWNKEKYSIYVSTQNTVVALSASGAKFTEGTLPGTATTRTLDLSAFAGQKIHIGIRHYDTTDQYSIAIDDVTVTAQTILAVSDVNKKAVSIYPNPATEVLNLNVDSKINSADIYDLAGKLVKSASVADNKVNVKDLQNGTYVLKVNTEAGSTSHKFIKK